MRETPRSQGTASEPGTAHPQPCPGCAFAHTTGASRSGTPHRSDSRSPQTPRGVRQTDPAGCFGTTPPVPKRPALLRTLPAFALCAVVLCAALFALITWQIAADGPLRALDERAGRALAGHGPRALTEALADLGSVAIALPVLAAAIAYTLLRDRAARRYEALGAVLAMAAVPALVVPLKALIDRPGPLTDATGYYPSGHTATAMAAYTGAALLLGPYLPKALRNAALPAAGVLSLATGVGLVLRGYHWPLDVMGSWCLCAAVLLIVSSGTRRISSRCTRRSSGRTAAGCSGPS
ncbi:phosphatase PAP2 family protein [Streptomyces katsurahamanus]|uniref:Phosphatase PAP2 family protein n=1 Tax=Streptomyces katsurahamanus TaxID=2577098 RepID=A0ABW9NXJ0_9ACTN|nr:phosphatase PAP2 family protein [Streptomyces katsurahamanus]MQS37569.1 phosphatase PAP2 family protein [Streptomyces katsurahamanus]